MSVPNIGPEHFDVGDPDGPDSSRRGNPAPLHRDDQMTDDVTAATTRATAVSHRFGGVRYALTRPDAPGAERRPPAEGGGPNPHE